MSLFHPILRMYPIGKMSRLAQDLSMITIFFRLPAFNLFSRRCVHVPTQSFPLLDQLAADVVRAQKIWDRSHQADRDAYGRALAAFTPPRLMVRSMELSARVGLSVEKELGFRLQVFPLNLGYDLRTGSRTQNESRSGSPWSNCPRRHPFPRIQTMKMKENNHGGNSKSTHKRSQQCGRASSPGWAWPSHRRKRR